MRREPEWFGEREMELVTVSRKLREAQLVERLLEDAGLDYVVEPGEYRATLLFLLPVTRVGAWFWLASEDAPAARGLLEARGIVLTARAEA